MIVFRVLFNFFSNILVVIKFRITLLPNEEKGTGARVRCIVPLRAMGVMCTAEGRR